MSGVAFVERTFPLPHCCHFWAIPVLLTRRRTQLAKRSSNPALLCWVLLYDTPVPRGAFDPAPAATAVLGLSEVQALGSERVG